MPGEPVALHRRKGPHFLRREEISRLRKTAMGALLLLSLLSSVCNTDTTPLAIDVGELPRQLTTSGRDFAPFWPPDGRWIAFLTSRNTYNPVASAICNELWIMDLNGRDQRSLVTLAYIGPAGYRTVDAVSWFPDSKCMLICVYAHDRLQSSSIWIVTVGGSKIQLTSENDYAQDPACAPDGSKIAFIVQGPNLPRGSPIFRLYVANPDGSSPVLIETGLIDTYSWKRDSRSLIYSFWDSEDRNWDIWQSSIDGTSKTRITQTLVNETYPSWSYDGTQITFSIEDSVFVTPADDFQPRRAMTGARTPQWIPVRNLPVVGHWVVDLFGNVILKISEGPHWGSVSFSLRGDLFVYSLDGNIWMDRLP